MNSVHLIGRLTRDPEVRYTSGSQMAVAHFTIAIDRPPRQGQERQADFPRIVVFGRQAETCEQYLAKGRLVAIEGRIQTGSYQNKDGQTVYTTDVVANRVEFLDWGDRNGSGSGSGRGGQGGYQNNRQQGGYNGNQGGYGGNAGGYQGGQGGYGGRQNAPQQAPQNSQPADTDIPDTFEAIDDDVPF